ncbi:MAG: UPF0182 family protein [Candidatus Helarchaeota archaeon]
MERKSSKNKWFGGIIVIGIIAAVAGFIIYGILLEIKIYRHIYSLKAGIDYLAILFLNGNVFLAFFIGFGIATLTSIGFIIFLSMIDKGMKKAFKKYKILFIIGFLIYGIVYGIAASFVLAPTMFYLPYTNEMNFFTLYLLPLGDPSAITPEVLEALQFHYNYSISIIGIILFSIVVPLIISIILDFGYARAPGGISKIFGVITIFMFNWTLWLPLSVINAASPVYFWIIWWVTILCLFGTLLFAIIQKKGNYGSDTFGSQINRFKGIGAIIIMALLIFIPVIISSVYYGLFWEVNYPNWQYPTTNQQIENAQWAAGITPSQLIYKNLTEIYRDDISAQDYLETGTYLRTWDKRTVQMGVAKTFPGVFYQLCEQDIINHPRPGRSYNELGWIFPLSVNPEIYQEYDPEEDETTANWISSHCIYTHAEGVIFASANTITDNQPAIFTGEDAKSELNLLETPLFYYGAVDRAEFYNPFNYEIYFDLYPQEYESGNYSFIDDPTNLPDYTLTGIESVYWFMFRQFAFSGRTARMLYLRDIHQRVNNALLPGIYADNDPYLIVENQTLKWMIGLYVDYSLLSQMAPANFLRLLGWCEIDITDGTMRWIKNPNLNENEFIMDVYMNFYNWENISSDFQKQTRFPEDLMNKMIQVDYIYHISANRGRNIWDIRSLIGKFEGIPDIPAYNLLLPINGTPNQVEYVIVKQVQFADVAEGQKLAGLYVFGEGRYLGNNTFYIADRIAESSIMNSVLADDRIGVTYSDLLGVWALIANVTYGNRIPLPLKINQTKSLYWVLPIYREKQQLSAFAAFGVVDASREPYNAGLSNISAYQALLQIGGIAEELKNITFYNHLSDNSLYENEEATLYFYINNQDNKSHNIMVNISFASDVNVTIKMYNASLPSYIDPDNTNWNQTLLLNESFQIGDIIGRTITLSIDNKPGRSLVTYIGKIEIFLDGSTTPWKTVSHSITVRTL